MSIKRVLAFDFGASSGRAILGKFDGEKIALEEIHRFENTPVMMNGTLYWDLPRLFHEVKQGLVKAHAAGGFESVSVDTWGVDFGLIGSDGALIELTVHYRDKRNDGMSRIAEKYIGSSELYGISGIQTMDINTVYQLLSLKENRPRLLDSADKILLMPNLFEYFLTGSAKNAELSIASTTGLVDAKTRNWSDEIINALGLPRNIFPEIISSGTVVGELSKELCEELSIPTAKVVSVCGHDTQCAAAAVPADEDGFVFISCGTWSLFGRESDEPVLDETADNSNEIGFGGKITYLKNIIGLWLIQESRRQWKREGRELSFSELEKQALAAPVFRSFIDPDAPEFVSPGNIPERVREYCRKTSQPVPETVGEIMRCIYESLALKYRAAFDEITGNKIYLMGGGAKDGLLCQMTANSCGVPVTAGPVEATAYGNIAVSLISCKAIPDIKTARKIIAVSDSVKTFLPESTEAWNRAYGRYISIIRR